MKQNARKNLQARKRRRRRTETRRRTFTSEGWRFRVVGLSYIVMKEAAK